MLNDSEQRSWSEIERMWSQDSRGSNGIRALAVGAVGVAIVFAVIGAPWAGLVVLAAPLLAWSLSRHWRDIATACETALVPVDDRVADGASQPRPQRVPVADGDVR